MLTCVYSDSSTNVTPSGIISIWNAMLVSLNPASLAESEK